METIHFILNYFISPDKRCKESVMLKDGSGIELSWGMNRSFSNLERYTNWLSSLIKLSNEIDMSPVKVAQLMQKGIIKKFNWRGEHEFLSIFLDSLERTDQGIGIQETILAHNAKILDK